MLRVQFWYRDYTNDRTRTGIAQYQKMAPVSECVSSTGTLQMTIPELAELITGKGTMCSDAVPVQDPAYDPTGTGRA